MHHRAAGGFATLNQAKGGEGGWTEGGSSALRSHCAWDSILRNAPLQREKVWILLDVRMQSSGDCPASEGAIGCEVAVRGVRRRRWSCRRRTGRSPVRSRGHSGQPRKRLGWGASCEECSTPSSPTSWPSWILERTRSRRIHRGSPTLV